MRLTTEQQETLYGLHVAGVGRPDDHTKALERADLVYTGKSRFGAWVKLTAKGKAEIMRFFGEKGCTKTMEHVLEKHYATDQAGVSIDSPTSRNTPPAKPPKTGATLPKPTTDQPRSKATQPRSAAARRDDAKSPTSSNLTTAFASPRRTPSTTSSSTPQRTARPSPQPPERAAGSIPAQANAVRVVANGKATYYPLTSYGSLKGDKAYVRTPQKLYRTVKLSEAGADVVF